MSKKERYLIGYKGSNQCVYGDNNKDDEGCSIYLDPFTSKSKAKKNITEQLSDNAIKVIYKLVPIKEIN